MKLFVGNDYTFCMSETCEKNESCMRWKGHYEKKLKQINRRLRNTGTNIPSRKRNIRTVHLRKK